MLVLPENDPSYRIISLDPGTDRLGVALIVVDLSTMRARLQQATTLIASRNIKHSPFAVDMMGERRARIDDHREKLSYILAQADPHCVISEAAYMGRFAQAFESLVECLCMLRQVVSQHDVSMSLEIIDSPTAKNAVGVSGKKPKGMESADYKEMVKQAIIGLDRLEINPMVDLNTLDEHATDAIAVGCYKLSCIAADII